MMIYYERLRIRLRFLTTVIRCLSLLLESIILGFLFYSAINSSIKFYYLLIFLALGIAMIPVVAKLIASLDSISNKLLYLQVGLAYSDSCLISRLRLKDLLSKEEYELL